MGTLTAMEPYRPYFVGLTVVLPGLAFGTLCVVPRACPDDEACGVLRTLQRQQAPLWGITIVAGPLIGIPWYAPYLIG